MSATFPQCNQNVITDLFGRPLHKVMWLELSCRGIYFVVIICYIQLETGLQTPNGHADNCVYKFQKAGWWEYFSCNGVDGEVIPLTGDNGLQFKVFTMHAFSQDVDGIDDSTFILDCMSLLSNLKIMPATKAADCRVSSTRCHCSYQIGLAPSMYSLVEEMGRVDRNPLLLIGGNCYEVHMSCTCAVKFLSGSCKIL